MTTTLDTLDRRPALPLTPIDRPRSVVRPPARPGRERNGNRRDRLHLALSELFGAREDLEGVSPVADVLAEDLLWSA